MRSLLATTREKPACSNEDPKQPKINKLIKKIIVIKRRINNLEPRIEVLLLFWVL